MISKICVGCGTDTVKNPLKHWFAGPKCDTCYRREQYNKPNSYKSLYEKKYRKVNKDQIRIKAKEYVRKKVSTDINFKLKRTLRRRLCEALKNNQKTGSAIVDLGCSVEELRIYLESKFLVKMTWDNHGKGKDKWNIDHVLPLNSFDLTNREEFLNACHYTNLQPLWEVDNLLKSDK